MLTSTRKFVLLLLCCVLVLALALGGCGKAPETTPADEAKEEAPEETPQETLVLRLAEVQPEDYPTTIGDKEMARIVEEKTNGRIKIEVYAGGQLGDEKSVIEAVQLGGIDFARVNSQPLSEFTKSLGVFSLPYLFDNEDHFWKVMNGPIGEEILADFEENDMIGLTYYDNGSRSFYNTKREVKSPADMKGMKIRVQQSELMVKLVECLGASATRMPFGEVYSALQTGVIDGAENNFPSYLTTSHYEVAKYFTLDQHTRVPEVVIASKVLWDKLSEEDRAIIKEAAVASQEVQREAWKEYEKVAEEEVRAAGCIITEVDDLKEWQDAMAPLYEMYQEEFGEWIERIRAAR